MSEKAINEESVEELKEKINELIERCNTLTAELEKSQKEFEKANEYSKKIALQLQSAYALLRNNTDYVITSTVIAE